MTRKSKKYQLLVITLLLCILQVAGIDVYAQSTVTPMKRDTTITQREAPKARARRHREPSVQDSLKKDSIRIVPSKELVPLDSLSAASIQIADSLDAANKKELKKIEQPASIMVKADSVPPAKDINKKIFIPNPTKATWLAVVFPGGGQIYNRKYWKLPIIYGGFAGCAYALSWNGKMYKDYSQAYLDIMDSNPNTKNYYVRYRDYIKNVASSEIYATWPDSTIRANVLAIMSFTLNRVYTEWYRNKGYDFTITSSTAFDHKWIPERNVYDTISAVVDEIFANYLSRPNVRQPILTQYCDGTRVSCPDWMTQWGSKELGDQGYTPIEILRYFYGSDMYINTAEEISGIPSSWPGYTLENGSSGAKVRQLQEQLNVIAGAYPALPKIQTDGVYGPATAEAVRKFQEIFGLPQTGTVDYRTWYKISQIYVGVSRIAELN